MSHTTFAAQLHDWRLLPQHQHFTELYFTDFQNLPGAVKPGVAQNLRFTVRSFERQPTNYHYTLIVKSDESKEYRISSGSFMLAHDHTRTIGLTVPIPPIGPRVEVKIVLQYEGAEFDGDTPHPQKQSIHYWADVMVPGNKK